MQTGAGENQAINCLETYTVEGTKVEISDSAFEIAKNLHRYSIDQKSLEHRRTSSDPRDRDATIALLKEEIKFALQSLKTVQVEVAKLRNEKENVCTSEKLTREGIKSLLSQVLVLQEGIGSFEDEVGLNVVTLDHKLQSAEEAMQELVISCSLKNEVCYSLLLLPNNALNRFMLALSIIISSSSMSPLILSRR